MGHDDHPYKKSLQLLKESKSFVISTIDRNNFPNVIIVSKPLYHVKLETLYFYINGDGKTALNISKNNAGCICCYKEIEHESLVLKGAFEIVDIGSIPDLNDKLNPYQKKLNYHYPVIAVFNTMIVTLHENLQMEKVKIDENG